VKFSTPYCGYAPGQKINFVLYINNESSIDITECEVKLKQEVSYESHDPQHEYRYDKHLIARRIANERTSPFPKYFDSYSPADKGKVIFLQLWPAFCTVQSNPHRHRHTLTHRRTGGTHTDRHDHHIAIYAH